MPDFMELLAKGIIGNEETVLGRIRKMADAMRESVSGISLPDLGLADGGLLNIGSLPDITSRNPGGATTNNNTRTTYLGGVNINVNGYNVQDDDALAERVAYKINEMLDEDGSVFK